MIVNNSFETSTALAKNRSLLDGLLTGNVRALARFITLVENAPQKIEAELIRIHEHTGKALLVGVTGFPGTGKSSLVDKLIATIRAEKKKVGVLAIDPSSPLSGGAILGDRVRMQHYADDSGVFIRSLGSRGHIGGTSRATRQAIKALDAFGFDVILIETVGTGQSEIEISTMVDCCLVVEIPGLGDEIQAMKAGILEVADLFVVNKCDFPGADRTKLDLLSMIEMGSYFKGWRPEVLLTQANKGGGVAELWAAIQAHHAFQVSSGAFDERRRRYFREELLEQMLSAFRGRVEQILAGPAAANVVECIKSRSRSPQEVAQQLLQTYFKEFKTEGEPNHVHPVL